MKKKPETLHTRTVARSRLFHVEAVGLRFANGVEVEYERLRPGLGSGAVLVVPVRSDGHVVLIREYAAGTDRYELGLPKGRVEKGEDPVAAAGRELREETGFAAERLECLRQMTVAPGYLAHATHIVLARDLYPSPLPGDEPETIEVVPWPLTDIDGLLAQRDLTEARSIAALFLVREHLRTEQSE
ncbi:MAG: ADP compounds hydrolase NudE [Ectothiorhodospiraceae bacterium]|jgi:ADP-ribose diphosphatase